MANRIQLRRDTAANWTRENPILSQGEPGFDLTANKLKVGDGVTAWTDLAYATGTTEGLIEFPVIDGDITLLGAVDEDFTIKTTRTDPGSDADINIYAADDIWMEALGDDIILTAADEVRIESNAENSTYQWTFRADGNLILPDNGRIQSIGDASNATLQWLPTDGDGSTSTSVYVSATGVYIETDAPGNENTWLFGTDGSITFPDNTIQTTAYTGGGASIGDFIITGTTISASTGSVSGSGFGISNLEWNSGDNTYIVSYASNPGYGYRTKVIFASTGVSQLDGNTFYLNPHNYPTNTQWELFSDLACTIKIDGSTFDAYTPGAGATNELIPGANIFIKTGTPSNNVDPGAIEFKIGGKTYGWTIDKDNHLRLPADGGASKIKNYYGHDALFANEAITATAITFPDGTTSTTAWNTSTAVWPAQIVGGLSENKYVEITTSTSAVVGQKYIVDTSNVSITVTLPGSGTTGDEITIIDGSGNASTHAIILDRNGGKIQGIASNMNVTTDRAAFTLVYYNSANGWILTNV